MDNEQKVQTLEGEVKLLKNEIKQTLSSVRDFLLDIKLPTNIEPESTPVNQALANMDPSSAAQPEEEPVDQSPVGGSDENNGGAMDDFGGPEGDYSEHGTDTGPKIENNEPGINSSGGEQGGPISDLGEDLADIDAEETGISAGEMPTDNKPRSETKPQTEEQEKPRENLPVSAPAVCASSSMSQVNMLANIIRWAAEARREIGMAQLPVFLDVYATSGYLTEEMKENILHIAEVATDTTEDEGGSGSSKSLSEQLSICLEIGSFNGEVPGEIRTRIRRLSELILQQTVHSNKAGIWSQMLLKLHGILINAGTPVQPMNLVKKTEKQESIPGVKPVEEISASDAGVELDADDADTALIEDDWAEVMDEKEDKKEQEQELNEEEILPLVKNNRPAKLRLILPSGDGVEQELDLGNLFIASDLKTQGDGHKKVSTRKRK